MTRNRIRQYPALINSTTTNWFLEWPREALLEVAYKFLEGVELLASITGPRVRYFTLHKISGFSSQLTGLTNNVGLTNNNQTSSRNPPALAKLFCALGPSQRVDSREPRGLDASVGRQHNVPDPLFRGQVLRAAVERDAAD